MKLLTKSSNIVTMSDLKLNATRASGLGTALNRTTDATIPFMRVPTKRTVAHSEDWITINPDRAVTQHQNAQEVTFTLPKAGICGDMDLQFRFKPSAGTGANDGIFFLPCCAALEMFDRVEIRHNNRVIQTIFSSWLRQFMKKLGKDARDAWEAMLTGNRVGAKDAVGATAFGLTPFAPMLQYPNTLTVGANEYSIFSIPLIVFFNHTTAHHINNNTTKGVITVHVFTNPLEYAISKQNFSAVTSGVDKGCNLAGTTISASAVAPAFSATNVMEPKLKVKFHNVEDYIMQAVQAQSEEAWDCVTYDTQCQGSNAGFELGAGTNHKIRLTGIQGCARELNFYLQYKSDQPTQGIDKNPNRFVEIYRARVTLGGKPIRDWQFGHELLVNDRYFNSDIGNADSVGTYASTASEHLYSIPWGFDSSLHSASDCLALGPQTADPILEIETFNAAELYNGVDDAGVADAAGNTGLIAFVNANVYNVVYQKAGEYSARTEE
jgi:hypothetical protein